MGFPVPAPRFLPPSRVARRWGSVLTAVLMGAAGLTAGAVSGQTAAHADDHGHAHDFSHDYDYGEMVDPYTSIYGARFAAREISLSPSNGPDFEVPFRCGEEWVGSTRSSHSPSRWSIDFNRSGDVGRPVLASARGIVQRVAVASGYGNYIIVDHGEGFSTLYAHLEANNVVAGQVVDQGDTLGFLGSTGRVTGPHLHFEMRLNGNYFAPYFHRTTFRYDRTISSLNCTDTPIVGDWDGNGVDDVGVYRQARTTGIARQLVAGATRIVRFGHAGDTPFVADWDGNGADQLGVREPRSTNFLLRGEDGRTSTANMGGAARDVPVAGHWVEGSKPGIGLYDVARRQFVQRKPDLSKRVISFGTSGTQPVLGDWDGDGVTDVGTFDPVSGEWQLRTDAGVRTIRYGGGKYWDIPVTGDWNGDGVTDIGVWRPVTAKFFQRVVAQPNTVRQRVRTDVVVYGVPRR